MKLFKLLISKNESEIGQSTRKMNFLHKKEARISKYTLDREKTKVYNSNKLKKQKKAEKRRVARTD